MSKYMFVFLAICLMLSLQAQNTQPLPDPTSYLDAPLPNTSGGKALKIEIGGNNFGAMYQNYNIASILQMVLNNNLFGDSDLDDSINYFLGVWPPASEMIALEQPTVYDEKMKKGGSYIVNESGRLISEDDVNSNAAYQTDLNASQTVVGRRLHASTYWSASDIAKYNAGDAETKKKLKQGIDSITNAYFAEAKYEYQNGRYRWLGYDTTKSEPWHNANQTIVYPDRFSGSPLNSLNKGQSYNTITLTTGSKKYILEEALVCSPIILDMDGDGKIEASEGAWMPHAYKNARVVEFDMDGDGMLDMTEWVGPNDGILMVATGNEVNAKNFFGDIDGFVNGYQKLSTLDKNNDKKLAEEELSTLSVWQDKNGNAKIDKGEVKSVAELGITSISLTYDQQFVSSFVQNGQSKKMWDWYPCMFRLKRTK